MITFYLEAEHIGPDADLPAGGQTSSFGDGGGTSSLLNEGANIYNFVFRGIYELINNCLLQIRHQPSIQLFLHLCEWT